MLENIYKKRVKINILQLQEKLVPKLTLGPRGGYRGGGGTFAPPPPEFGLFCSYFQNSFSLACLGERNPSSKQEKYLSK